MNTYFYDDPNDEDELVLTVNNIDSERMFAGDPFNVIAALEEQSGRPLILSKRLFNPSEEVECPLNTY